MKKHIFLKGGLVSACVLQPYKLHSYRDMQVVYMSVGVCVALPCFGELKPHSQASLAENSWSSLLEHILDHRLGFTHVALCTILHILVYL